MTNHSINLKNNSLIISPDTVFSDEFLAKFDGYLIEDGHDGVYYLLGTDTYFVYKNGLILTDGKEQILTIDLHPINDFDKILNELSNVLLILSPIDDMALSQLADCDELGDVCKILEGFGDVQVVIAGLYKQD